MTISKWLDSIRLELEQLTEALRVSNEQLSFLGEVADDARTEMLVSQAPLEKRQFDEASGNLERQRRYHHEIEYKIKTLQAEQDELLDRMLSESPG